MTNPKLVTDKELDEWLRSEVAWQNYSETIRSALEYFIGNVDEASVVFERSLNFYELKKKLHKAFFVMLKYNKAKKYKKYLKLGESRLYFEDDRLMHKDRFSQEGFPFDLIEEYSDFGQTYYSSKRHKEIDKEFEKYLALISKKIKNIKYKYSPDKPVITITKEIKSTISAINFNKFTSNTYPLNVEALELVYSIKERYTTKFEFELRAKIHKSADIILSRLDTDAREIWCRPLITKNMLSLLRDLHEEINKRIKQNRDLEQELINAMPVKYLELLMIEELKK